MKIMISNPANICLIQDYAGKIKIYFRTSENIWAILNDSSYELITNTTKDNKELIEDLELAFREYEKNNQLETRAEG